VDSPELRCVLEERVQILIHGNAGMVIVTYHSNNSTDFISENNMLLLLPFFTTFPAQARFGYPLRSSQCQSNSLHTKRQELSITPKNERAESKKKTITNHTKAWADSLGVCIPTAAIRRWPVCWHRVWETRS